MYNESTATFIKIQQMRLFQKSRNASAAEIGDLFNKYGVWEFIDDSYEFLHIQGAYATFEDISDYLDGCGALQ